jgi:CHAT domain-containing protein/tetratricopeptide (TPR) repeat protein
VFFGAVIGSTLMALSLAGSSRNPATSTAHPSKAALAGIDRLFDLGAAAMSEGRYQDARNAFWAAATAALKAGSNRKAAQNWQNAGFASLLGMQYKPALEDLTRARKLAESSGEMVPLIYALNTLSSLYLHMGEPANALRLSVAALEGPAGHADARMRARLFYEKAQALTDLGRFPEAEPIFRQSLAQMMAVNDLDASARAWAALGEFYIDAGRLDDAEWALSESLRLVRTHRLKAATQPLIHLARLRGKQGRHQEAETLFSAAFAAHETVTPLWVVYLYSGQFHLDSGDDRAAFRDFREAQLLASRMRIDVVPADQDRIALESHESQIRILAGVITSGNRLALEANDASVLSETFDAAEQGRLWSLRSLVPEANDWRSHLPAQYWDLLARFQAAERALWAQPSSALEKRTADLQLELQHAEVDAGGDGVRASDESPLAHVRAILEPNSALFSFSITKAGSWMWLVTRGNVRVYNLPPADQIETEVTAFKHALQEGKDADAPGRRLYATLFGQIPAGMLAKRRWLLEPDGPLYDLPFAALPVGSREKHSWLVERTAVQAIPGALLMETGGVPADGKFVGIGDPVFNTADPRYRGSPAKMAIMLTRLPNTASEVAACSLAWDTETQSPHLLTGTAATARQVTGALADAPAVIHFATHVVAEHGQFGSGLIALGLDSQGAMGLLGPRDIAARPVPGALVVMNGCHSAQGVALPGSGLMGLTRAWIGAGASAVVSTRWDVPDDTAQSLMVNFYKALRGEARGNPAQALRYAQLAAIRSNGPDSLPSRWAAYSLLSRI